MDIKDLLKVGILVDVTTTDGKIITGYLDEVGATQEVGYVLLSNRIVILGEEFTGKKISISKIMNIIPSNNSSSSF